MHLRHWLADCWFLYRRRTSRRLFRPAGIPELLEIRTLLSGTSLSREFDAIGATNAVPHNETEQFVTLIGIEEHPDASLQLAQSTPQIGLDVFRADPLFAGIDGVGYSIVVIDTGIALNHPFFGPDADSNGISDRIVYSYDFSGANDSDASDTIGHGSNVAGIVASSDGTYTGMAPGANIIALKVFPDNSNSASSADIEEAIQWVTTHVNDYNIVGVNLSLGAGNDSTYSNSSLRDEFASLASQNVVVVCSAGNSFFTYSSTQGVAWPASDPHALAVSAVYDGNHGQESYTSGAIAYSTDTDRITPFSQRSETLTTIFAPGAVITSANQSGGIVSYSGTSQAAPHIAGIVALAQDLAVQELGRKLNPDEFALLLKQTGVTINDGDDENDNVTNTGLNFKRVDVQALGQAILAMAATPNSAPTLDNTGNTALNSFNEDSGSNNGTPISDLIASMGPSGGISDADTSALQGIAIVGADTTNGTWQYSTYYTGWQSLGSPSASSARLLAARPGTSIRFVPNVNYNGTVTNALTFRAWDRTSGINGGIGDVSAGTAFSVDEETASVMVTPTNDAPVLGGFSGGVTYVENASPLRVAVIGTVTDIDSTNFDGGQFTVSITSFGVTPDDRLEIRNEGTGSLQIGVSGTEVTYSGVVIGSFTGGVGTAPLVVTLNSNADIEATQALFQNFTFRTLTEAPSTTTRTVQFNLSDGDGGMSATLARAVFVTAVNDAPVLNTSASPVLSSIAEDDQANTGTLISDLIASVAPLDLITDVDTSPLEGIAIIAADTTHGTWQFTVNGGTIWTNLGTPSANPARTLAANSSTRIRFLPSPDFNGTITSAITFRAWDQTAGVNGSTGGTTSNGGTTPYSVDFVSASLTVTSVNDAPILNNSGDPFLSAIDEDDVANNGTLISSLIGNLSPGGISDIDAGSVQGLAITAADTSRGLWEFSPDDGTSWASIGSVTDNNARLLAADASTRLRFLPDVNDHGTVPASLTFRAWDRSSGTNGTTADTSVNGGISAFSLATETASIQVNPVNDTPELLSLNQSTIAENSPNQPIGTLSTIDVDVGDTFTYSIQPGGDGAQFAISGSQLVVGAIGLDFEAGGTRTVTIRTTDQGGLFLDQVFVITVTNTLDAPVLNPVGSPFVTSIAEDDTANTGTLITDLIARMGAGRLTDQDAGALQGVAIIANDTTNGSWQFRKLDTAPWTNVGSRSEAAALLLAADAQTRIRFVPNANYNGSITAALTFVGWDRTTGTNGWIVNAATRGNATAFSVAFDTASLTITNVNDAPVLTAGTPVITPINEDVPSASNLGMRVIDLVAAMSPGSITDVDAGALQGIAVISASHTNGVWQFRKLDTAGWTNTTNVTPSAALILAADAQTRIRFVPNANFNGTVPLTFVAWDRSSGNPGAIVNASARGGTTSYSGATQNTSLTVNAVNDAPSYLSINKLTVNENTPNGVVGTLTSGDVDVGQTFTYSIQPGGNGAQFAISGNQLVVGATGLDFEAGATRTVTVRTTDQGGLFYDRTFTVTVTNLNDAPVVDNSGTPTLDGIPMNVADASNTGTLISDLIARMVLNGITDQDAGALRGVAIINASQLHGTWQFRKTDVAAWTNIGVTPLSDTRGLLLASDATTRIRFVPATGYTGTESISFRAWDRTTGSAGSVADTSLNSGTTAFSSAFEDATLLIV